MEDCNNDIEELDRILQDKFTSAFRSGYVQVDGVTMPSRYKELQSEIENLEVFDTDVWVCSFPKTGTTWTQEMVWLLANNCDFQGAQDYIQARFPFLEVSALFDFRRMMEENKEFQPPPHYIDSIKFIKEMRGTRFIKTHLPWNLLPKQIRNGERKPKIIYIARNPKDTCISYYHHSQTFEAYSGDFQDFCKLFLNDKLCFAPYWKNLLSFWEQRVKDNVIFIKYEDMKQDISSVILRLSDFLQVTTTKDQVGKLKNHLSFESMKKNPAVNYENIITDLNEKFNLKPSSTFMRSGQVGGYKNMMSEDIQRNFNKWTEVNMKNIELGY